MPDAAIKEIRIKKSNVFTRIAAAKTRYIVNEGSSRSTKTYSILQYLIGRALESPKIKITVTRAKSTWIRDSAFVDFRDILDAQFKMFERSRLNMTEMKYLFPNGSLISFIGLDEEQKTRGRKQDYTWINEANECDYKSYRQLSMRTTKQIILDYNPSMEEHWIFDKVARRPDCTLIHSTYKDNPFLEPEVRREIESLEPTPENIEAGTADDTLWKVYGLGLRASPKGLVYPSFTIVRDLPPPELRKKQGYGLDFGYTNDPSALCHAVLSQGELYLDEKFYKRGLTNCHNPRAPNQLSIESEFKICGGNKALRIWADSAEPKSIQELKQAGFSISGAVKGQDSIINGIDILKRYKLNVTERSLNLIKELRNYKWQEDRAKGAILNKPIDAFCHLLDAIRYWAMMELGGNSVGSFAGDAQTSSSCMDEDF